METNLPVLKSLVLSSFLTIRKGIKVNKEGIDLTQNFSNVSIDDNSLRKYMDFMEWENEIPLTFFYLMAQRAQAALMLRPEFTIAIPGLVHVSNTIRQLSAIDYSSSFELVANVKVDYKETGSLVPSFVVEFLQNDVLVIQCESVYIAKRNGTKNSSHRREENKFIVKSGSSKIWNVPKGLGRVYGKASGDKNPIHSYDFFAKRVGFRSAILQGWFGVSKVVKECEMANGAAYTSIVVDFRSPIFLPSKQKLEWTKGENNEVHFQIVDNDSGKLVLNGRLS
jgi:acyl dehydratase